MSNFVGPFLGFSIGGIHSSELKIVRVSSGDRYEQNLLPEFKDRTVEVPGGNGSYYFGSNYTNRKFTINFAFDSLTEYEIRRLTQVLGFQGLQPLVFDETPYKHYMVKCAQSPQLKYICFEGNNYVDIYKGEGTLNLVSYYPFALGQTFYWWDKEQNKNNAVLDIYNEGDLPTDNFKCFMETYNHGLQYKDCGIRLFNNSPSYGSLLNELVLEAPAGSIEEDTVLIDFRTRQIVGINNFKVGLFGDGVNSTLFHYDLTTNIYNNFIVDGDFFKIPLGRTVINNDMGSPMEYNFLYY